MFFGTRDAAEAVAEVKKAAAGAPQSADRELRTPEPVPPAFGRTVPEDNGDAGYPLYGDFASHIKPCAFWEKSGSEPATRIANKVRALILQNDWDSQTPLTSSQGLRRAMKGSKDGHGRRRCRPRHLRHQVVRRQDGHHLPDHRQAPREGRDLQGRSGRGRTPHPQPAAAPDTGGPPGDGQPLLTASCLGGPPPAGANVGLPARWETITPSMGNDLRSLCVFAHQRIPSVPPCVAAPSANAGGSC
ncbi:alpha/beta hydrolase [Streptomyces sp. NPDC007929]|uniref:alpha/beta hydrolase n=1 Tax=unclassified Streptomyces TaxID=2593676 RepID=UPI0036EA4492